MTPPRVNQDDVGAFYEADGGELWRLIAYTDRPTATFERVVPAPTPTGAPMHRTGVVGAPIFDGLRRLVPETP